MDNTKSKKLCLELIQADSEQEVIELLKQENYWDNPNAWRFYGDSENNFSTAGNQQSFSDSALVEKLVNSVDARLINECLSRNIDLETGAPKNIREAVALFFDEEFNPASLNSGRIKFWENKKRTEVAKGITLASTGAKPKQGNPCLTIADNGEGQTPSQMPFTLLSLNRSNKVRIPFVQGKFNMGGTGVLKFCGRENLELILSRRNPKILPHSHDPIDLKWSFTIVRRIPPQGNFRNSTYKYLAPIDSDSNPGKGSLLCFTSETMPIFPDGRNPYARESAWGTLIKLYEYSLQGPRSNILLSDGLLYRLDILLPEVALPIRVHECRRGYKGHSGSFDTNLTGISVRLEDNRASNIEEGFPSSSTIHVNGEAMNVTIYAFKRGKAETYRKREGVIFTYNGQTHGDLAKSFFRGKKVGLDYLANSILVIVDCSKFRGRAREDFLMNSRDRISGGEFRSAIESELQRILKEHEGLRALKEKRRNEEIESKLDDNKPLEEVLKSILKQSPTLSSLFLKGNRLSNAFKSKKVREKEEPFDGKKFPSFFKFKGKEYGKKLTRECPINSRCRVAFETDVENDYFSRDLEPGEFSFFLVNEETQTPVDNYTLNLHNGIANLNIKPPENIVVGNVLELITKVTDSSRVFPFENCFEIKVTQETERNGGKGKRRKPPNDQNGSDRDVPTGIQLPNIKEVTEDKWEQYEFNKLTALRVKYAGDISNDPNGESDAQGCYDFFVNMDNFYLKNELKISGSNYKITKARFKYGLVLLGLGYLNENSQNKEGSSNNQNGTKEEEIDGKTPEDQVGSFSDAIAPILLPMIEALGSDLDIDGFLVEENIVETSV